MSMTTNNHKNRSSEGGKSNVHKISMVIFNIYMISLLNNPSARIELAFISYQEIVLPLNYDGVCDSIIFNVFDRVLPAPVA